MEHKIEEVVAEMTDVLRSAAAEPA